METDTETQILNLLRDMQKQLNYLERKVDALSRPSGSRPPAGRNAAPEKRYPERDDSAFSMFKKKGPGRPAGKGRGLPGSTYPKKNQTFKPKKKRK